MGMEWVKSLIVDDQMFTVREVKDQTPKEKSDVGKTTANVTLPSCPLSFVSEANVESRWELVTDYPRSYIYGVEGTVITPRLRLDMKM